MDNSTNDTTSASDDLHLRLSESEEEDYWDDNDIAATSSQVGDSDARMTAIEERMVRMENLLLELHAVVMSRSRPPAPKAPLFEDVEADETLVKIGNGEHSVMVDKQRFQRAVSLATTGRQLILKLMGIVFNPTELITFSFNGDRNVVPELLPLVEDHRFVAIRGQVSKSYPGFDSPKNLRRIREAVNGKCRKMRMRRRNSSTSSSSSS